jgi:hypothetical protein
MHFCHVQVRCSFIWDDRVIRNKITFMSVSQNSLLREHRPPCCPYPCLKQEIYICNFAQSAEKGKSIGSRLKILNRPTQSTTKLFHHMALNCSQLIQRPFCHQDQIRCFGICIVSQQNIMRPSNRDEVLSPNSARGPRINLFPQFESIY